VNKSHHTGRGPDGKNITRFYSIAEVAEMVGVATRTVRRWIASGQLVAHRWQRRLVRISEHDLRAFLAAHRA
jgi:excisionase family DNA binding protein